MLLKILPVPHQVFKSKSRSFMDCILDVLNTNSSRQIYKYNPYHDRQGKFARADEGVGGGSKKQRNDGGEEEKEEQVRNEIIPRMNSTQLYRQSPHIPVTNEFLERKSALERKGQYGPSYVTQVKSKFVCKLPSGITVDNYAARRAACSSAIWCR
ncbi:hypothetical protein [Eubacterium pyruvativorans]|uniref:hypothetical protein n=1 Tax=Eubacterium pyruvativorans TaxID=155865 RepID=UPI003F8C5408